MGNEGEQQSSKGEDHRRNYAIAAVCIRHSHSIVDKNKITFKIIRHDKRQISYTMKYAIAVLEALTRTITTAHGETSNTGHPS